MVAWSNLPAEVKDRLLDERRQARSAAAAFARICRDGSDQQLYDARFCSTNVTSVKHGGLRWQRLRNYRV
jgi:hypothetical protein